MAKSIRSFLIVSSIALLGACGGGSKGSRIAAGPSGSTGTIFDGPSGIITQIPIMPAAGSGPFTSMEVASYDSLGTLDLSGATLGAPQVTSATYNGFTKLLEKDPTNGSTLNVYIGRATLNADFSRQSLTGSTTDFFRNTGTPGNTIIANQVTGTIPIIAGSTIRDTFIGSLNGTLDDRGRTLVINSNFLGGSFSKLGGQDIAITEVGGTFGNVPNLSLLTGQIVAAR